jgi:hypothetical protein
VRKFLVLQLVVLLAASLAYPQKQMIVHRKDGSKGINSLAQIDSVTFMSNLVAEYLFKGNANDGSGNGNNGTVSGATFISERLNNAYSFNGSGNIITVPHSASLSVTPSYSISLWVKPATGYGSGNDYYQLLGKWGSGSTAAYLLGIQKSGKIGFTVYNGGAYGLTSKTVIPQNAYTHIIALQSADTVKIFINGTLDTMKVGTPSPQTSPSPIEIGQTSDFNEGYTGIIDDIRIYNRALTAQEIQILYHE